MKNPSLRLIGYTFVSAIALTACSSDLDKGPTRAEASANINAVNAQIGEDSSRLKNMTETGRPANIRVREGLYLGRDGFRTGRGDPLPRKFETDQGVSIHSAQPIGLPEITKILRRTTGLRIDPNDVTVTPPPNASMGRALRAGGGGGGGGGADSTGSGGGSSSGDDDDDMPTGLPQDMEFKVDYTGPLSGLLDYVAAQIGADWEYRGGRIKFLGAQTVTYTVWALSGTSTSSGSVGGGGSGDVFGSSSPAITSRSIDLDYWTDLEAGLDSIVPPGGAQYSVNKSNGSIVLTGLQNVHERVSDFIEKENARLSRQVAIKVDVLAYNSSSSDGRSTSIDAIIKNMAWGVGANISTPSNAISGGVGLGATILDNDNKVQENLVGTNAILNVLSKSGKASLLRSVSVIAMNNTPTPMSIMNEKAYLSGSKTTTDSNGNDTTELETGIINHGVNLVVTPRILSSGEVNLDYTMNLSSITGLTEFQSDGASVQLPEVETQNFMQSVNMGSGAAMVIASYDTQQTGREGGGPFDPRLWGFGGQDNMSTGNTKIMVIMSPVVVERQNSPNLRR